MSEIKPCPFCGSSNIEFTTFDFHESCRQDTQRVAMECQDCNAMGGIETINIEYQAGRITNDYDAIKIGCIKNWNVRNLN